MNDTNIQSISLKNYVTLLRLPQWSKAIFIFIGVIYSNGKLDDWLIASQAAFAFCLVASAVYIYNDLRDCNEDCHHVQKAKRPLASQRISVQWAYILMVVNILAGFLIAINISTTLMMILGCYLGINFLYNHGLRELPISDVMCIASGFMLRTLAGTIGVNVPITWWLVIAATLLSLLIALCKRYLEIRFTTNGSVRPALKKYNLTILEHLITYTASGSIVFYTIYVFFVRHGALSFLLTIPCTMIGLWRMIHLTYHSKHLQTDDPVALFLADEVSCINAVIFFILTVISLW